MKTAKTILTLLLSLALLLGSFPPTLAADVKVTTYKELSEAVGKARGSKEDPVIITLGADIVLDKAINIIIGQYIVVDLNGHTITGGDSGSGSPQKETAAFRIGKGGYLILKDSAVANGSINADYCINNSGNFTMESGILSGTRGIYAHADSTSTMNGGTIQSEFGVLLSGGANFIMNGGNCSKISASNGSQDQKIYSTITINGGEITDTRTAINVGMGYKDVMGFAKIIINGGEIRGGTYGISYEVGNGTVLPVIQGGFVIGGKMAIAARDAFQQGSYYAGSYTNPSNGKTIHTNEANYVYTFTDIAFDAWYFDAVVKAYAQGQMGGTSATTFDPDGNVTLAQAITMAARIHSTSAMGENNFDHSVGNNWFDTYVNYCKENNIIKADYADYNKNATRAQFAEIFAAALPVEALSAKNNIANGAIPDVPSGASYTNAVYTLYRAGVLTGEAGTGAFRPAEGISRAEAAAIVTRMLDDTLRREVTLG